MPRILTEQEDTKPVLPPDTVITVRVRSCEIRPVGQPPNTWDKLQFTCDILQVPTGYEALVGERIWASTRAKLTTADDNVLRRWVEALTGFSPTEGFELDTDILQGREARAVVKNWTTSAGAARHEIADFLPRAGAEQSFGTAGLPSQEQRQPVTVPDDEIPF